MTPVEPPQDSCPYPHRDGCALENPHSPLPRHLHALFESSVWRNGTRLRRRFHSRRAKSTYGGRTFVRIERPSPLSRKPWHPRSPRKRGNFDDRAMATDTFLPAVCCEQFSLAT